VQGERRDVEREHEATGIERPHHCGPASSSQRAICASVSGFVVLASGQLAGFPLRSQRIQLDDRLRHPRRSSERRHEALRTLQLGDVEAHLIVGPRLRQVDEPVAAAHRVTRVAQHALDLGTAAQLLGRIARGVAQRVRNRPPPHRYAAARPPRWA